MAVKDELIFKLLEELDLQTPKNQKLQDYYDGKHKILNEAPKVDSTRNDERAYFNYCAKIVHNYVGYVLGNPVSYQSKQGNKEFVDIIDFYFSYWEKEHNIRLKKLTETFGYAYEVAYSNKELEFQCAAFSPLEMIVLHDGSIERNISVGVRRYKKPFDDNIYVDVWDDVHFTKYQLNGGLLKQIERKNNFLSICPVIESTASDSRKSAFWDIMRIIDLYNSVQSTAANEILDHRTAYLVIENADLTIEQAAKMKQNGIILAPPGSKVYWATKDPHGSFIKDMLKDWQDEIYIQSNTVNLNENFQSNTSGVSVRLKLQELENITSIKVSLFEKVLKKRMKLFCAWLKYTQGLDFDFRDSAITFTRNIPVDEQSIVSMIVALQGILPQEDLLSWLPRVSDPGAALERLKKEQDSMGLLNLDKQLAQQDGVVNE